VTPKLALPTRLLRRLAREDGIALVMALGTSMVLAMAGTSALLYTTQNSNAASRSKADQLALSLAEAGLNYAYATLSAAPDPTRADAVSRQTVALAGGTATYWGSYDWLSKTWTLSGLGRVRNPTGPAVADVVRTASGKATVSTSGGAAGGAGAWQYIYADDPSSCATLDNSSTVNVPLYVRGNLCLNQSATLLGPGVQVAGGVYLNGSQTAIGSSDALASEVHVGRGCTTNGGTTFDTPCGAQDRVYATVSDNRPGTMTKPPVDLAGWYQNAMPGPMHGCTLGSFPGGFDTNGVMDRSRGQVDLTPTKAYNCEVWAGGQLVGKIAWSGGNTGTLTIQGTIFIDGDVVMKQLVRAVYQGRGTIYASGTISMQNHVELCAVQGCGAGWDTSKNLLALVAGSSTDATGFSLDNNSTFQGAIYAVNDYSAGNNTTVWGPIIARQIYLTNSTLNEYPPIDMLLPGMPTAAPQAPAVTIQPGSWSS
jgi:hypothetical protein